MRPKKTDQSHPESAELKVKSKTARHAKSHPDKRTTNKAVLKPSRDISKVPELANALKLIADKNTDKVLIKNFLTKCMVELKTNKARLKVTVPAELTTPGECYISNFPSNEVTIWENWHIKGHMSLQDALDAHIPACSVRPR